ncbi:hypothetical protein GLYMA_18G153000v4 [Glycine max]|uniref:BSD domain-containing protein n=2 Tax=Glycine max TaxID=3847 RepID=C6TJV1_SOYBN|nr:uncharacterized protein LOC100805729 [Glycine max]ACU23191.1 unknown [Glycine max]KAG4921526.1 hypothetical protein JHK86_050339 [Glycine max]KAG5094811.1 hypothetical protein JHK84_050399 [Glycine max]KAH1154652.1 hypothetical protein GYH30_050084 [Glycine max]KRG99545.1 hypothetical protein GLYMA_18G153000v4 [Glycine max]|eukprot:NP_001240156.1 uncharacterized protein LOC100805729 [Glycine max]
MDWLRRGLSRGSRNSKTPNIQTQSNSEVQQHLEESIYGITEELINHIKTFTLDTFKNFPLQDEVEGSYGEDTQSSSTKVRNELSQWQEKHAILVLSRVKEMSQLRYVLCPRHLKESQFWKIYFKLARSHVLEYELRDIQREKLKQMAVEDEKSSDNNPYEVEMAEANHENFIEPLPPS